MAFSIVNRLLFKPPPPVPYLFPSEIIRLRTRYGNEIFSTFIQRPGSTITLLVSHGNAEDLNTSYETLVRLSSLLNVHVIAYDYSGYGNSTGEYGGSSYIKSTV